MTAAVMDDRLFIDAVMARVANEPLPTPARALRIAVASLDRVLAGGAIWSAWHLATARSMVVRRGARLRSAALLAALLLMLAIGTTLAAAGAVVVVKTITDHPTPTESTSAEGGQGHANGGGIRLLPNAAPTDTPGFLPVGGGGNQPTPGTDMGDQPSPSPDADNPGDDNPGDDNPGPGGGDSPGGGDNSGGGDNGDTPSATDAPDATDTPEATDEPKATDEPEATDQPEATHGPEATDAPDDGGSDDGGGDSSD